MEGDRRVRDLSGLWLGGRYTLTSLRAMGALCAVYNAQDAVLERAVVVKVIPPALVSVYEETLATAAPLAHPAFLALYDVIPHDGQLFLAQELVDGHPLSEYLTAGTAERRAVALSLQIARAIAYAHERGIAHGDLTSAATLVDRAAVAHVNNLGAPPDWDAFEALARNAAASGVGAPAERALPLLREDVWRRDVWAIGALLWSLVASPSAPNDPADAPATPAVTPRAFHEDVSEEVRALVAQTLDLTRADALTRADELALALAEVEAALTPPLADHGGMTPLAVRAYREQTRDAAPRGAAGVGQWRRALGNEAVSASAPTLGGAPLYDGVPYPLGDEAATRDPRDENDTRPSEDAPFQLVTNRLRLPSRPVSERQASGVGLQRARYGAVYGQTPLAPAWAREEPTTPGREQEGRVGAMRPWMWTVIGVALFVAFFVVGFFVYPQVKLF